MSLIPFDDRDGVIWLDGALVPWREAKLHVLSHALHYASAVFEGERVYEGEIFKLTEHTERLHASGQMLGFEIPYSVAEIDQACREVVDALGFKDGYLRPVAWRGSEMMGVSAQQTKIHVAIAGWEWPSYFDPEQRLKGIRLKTLAVAAPGTRHGPVQKQSGRPLHDLYAVQARGRKRRL